MSRSMPPPHVLAAADREYAQARDAIDSAVRQVRANLQAVTDPAPMPSEVYNAAAYQIARAGISYDQLVALASAALTAIITDTTTTERTNQ